MKNCIGSEFLKNVVAYTKYARYTDENNTHKEVFSEIINRSCNTLKKQAKEVSVGARYSQKAELDFYFEKALKSMHDGLLLPSMRLMQFAGGAVERNNQRIFNCTYKAITKVRDISEIFYMLLCGCGVGYSVMYRHISNLPNILDVRNKPRVTYKVPDTIEGWAEAVRYLISGYLLEGNTLVDFDYSLIRPKGSILKVTGGVAPGYEPLKKAIDMVEAILSNKSVGSKLTSLELSDIVCILANCVLSGGNRRSALIALFDFGDIPMTTCKHGDWYTKHPYRARANFSAVKYVGDMDNYKEYYDFWDSSFTSGFGEPGQIITNCPFGDFLTNPCGEIALRDGGACNLCEINSSKIKTEREFYDICTQAALIGTIQATFTDFTYVSNAWSNACKEDALLGIGITGIHSSKFMMKHYKNGTLAKILEYAAMKTKAENELYADVFGINPAKRITTIKPAGSTSCIFGCSSGIHPIYSEYFIRRVRINKLSNLYGVLSEKYPSIIEDSLDNPVYDAVISIPVKMKSPVGKYTKDVSALEQVEMARFFTKHWIEPGHIEGTDKHAVSLTIHFKPDEKDALIERLYDLRHELQRVSIFPLWDGKYPQQVFEAITDSEYKNMITSLDGVNNIFNNLKETNYIAIDTAGACDGGACELKL